jgi:hypothetical protein
MTSSVRLLGRLDPNFAWDGSRIYDQADFRPGLGLPVSLRGAVASVEPGPSGTWRLLRDPLGLNKLFWAPLPRSHPPRGTFVGSGFLVRVPRFL